MGRNRTPEREQFLADILTTAIEGGINYWAEVAEYRNEHSVPVADTFAVIYDEDDKEYRITIDTVAKGIGVIKGFDYQPNYFGDGGAYWRELLKADRTNGDDGDYDAIVADWIVQAGLFGRIIYG